MRHIQIFSLLLAVMLSQGIYANEPSDSSYLEKEKQARELAQEVLDGREVVVRVYNDFEIDPPGYTKVNVRLQGLRFNYESIKAVLPDIDESSVIVILGCDQTDPAVVTVLGNYVSSNHFVAKGNKDIWPLWSYTKEYQYLLFTDALGNSIPNAKVDVKICLSSFNRADYENLSEVSIGAAVLDDSGRYFSPIWGNINLGLNYIISHPNYGTASVQNHRGRDADNMYVVPLVPLDSEAASRSFRGYVVNSDGEPVVSLPVQFNIRLRDSDIKEYEQSNSAVLTDDKGQFSVYAPLELNGELYRELAPDTIEYDIKINPPKFFNLYSYYSMNVIRGGGIPVGQEPKKFTLQSMNPDMYFHTLVFQDDQGVIDDPAVLEKITIAVRKDNRIRQRLTYEEIKDGCYLNEGTLEASTLRWNELLTFQIIELTEDSLQEVVLKVGYEKIYQGKVMDVKTGLPVPNVLVLAQNSNMYNEELDKLYERIDELRLQAKNESIHGLSVEQMYKTKNRVALTDEYGYYQFDFRTGISKELNSFTVLDKNYYAVPVRAITDSKRDIEIIDVPVIELLPPEARNSPVIWFEDAAGGIITDPNILENIWIKFYDDEGLRSKSKYSTLIREQKWIKYGTYEATLNYDDFNYVYEPVTIDWDSPQEIFFKVKNANDREAVLQSKVVNGVTGEPIPGAIVYINNPTSFTQPSSDDLYKYQDIIASIGDDFDPGNAEVQKLKQVLNVVSITQTDLNGEFELRVDHQYISDGPMSYIMAIKKNFISARQDLEYMLPGYSNNPESSKKMVYKQDEDGIIRFVEMRLFPSAWVNLELNLPDMNSNGRDIEVRYHYRMAPDDPTPWLKKFWETPKEGMGASTVRQSSIPSNGQQTISIPAGVELSLVLYTLQDERAGIVIGGIKLEQGQSFDLGLVEFPPALRVYVKVIDSMGNPIPDVTVTCSHKNGFYWGEKSDTNAKGLAILNVWPDSEGRFSVACRDKDTDETLRESIPYEVRDEEDAETEFILQLSDEILRKLSQ